MHKGPEMLSSWFMLMSRRGFLTSGNKDVKYPAEISCSLAPFSCLWKWRLHTTQDMGRADSQLVKDRLEEVAATRSQGFLVSSSPNSSSGPV